MIFQLPAGRRAATDYLRNGGGEGEWPGQRRSSGLRLAGVVGWALVAAVAASAQVQYRDRNGQTWSAPNQIDRQRREDNQARHDANSVLSDDKLSQELAAYWKQERAWEEGQRAMHEWERRRNAEVQRERDEQNRKAAQRAFEAAEAVEKKERYPREQRRIAAAILRAAKAGTSVTAEAKVNLDVVAALAEGLITGTFRGMSLAALEIKEGEAERFAMAVKLYALAGGQSGHGENRVVHVTEARTSSLDPREIDAAQQRLRWDEVTSGPGRYDFDVMCRAGLLKAGRGDLVLAELGRKNTILWRDDEAEITTALGCALAEPASELKRDPKRLQLAVRLLASAMGRKRVYDADGAALAYIFVEAARWTPELRRVGSLLDYYIPRARSSIWAQGVTSWPKPDKGAAPPALPPVGTVYWKLAGKLTLSPGFQPPLPLFADLREHLRENRKNDALVPATADEKKLVQEALDGWLARSGQTPAVRAAIQADWEMAAAARQTDISGTWRWDRTQCTWARVRSSERMAEAVALLHDPESFQKPAVRLFFATTDFQSEATGGLVNTYLGEACAASPRRAARALTALRWVTEVPQAMSYRDVPRARWEALVKLGESLCAAGDPQWIEPSVSARLARLRSERLGDNEGAVRWLAAPGRQPGENVTAEKWQEWATLGGRPGLVVAAQRHPEHWAEPALLRRVLNGVAGNGVDGLSPAARVAVKSLVAHADNITDPETVLVVAQVRGLIVGDWARLGKWLDDPRRRPKGQDDPLYPLFFKAIMERDQAEGYLDGNLFQPPEYAEACRKLERWLEAVLVAKGAAREKLIEENFPAVIFCPPVEADPKPDLRMLGYDAARGGFASRALLLLSTPEFDPRKALLAEPTEIEVGGRKKKVSPYRVEPWLAAVAKLPRSVPAEVLLDQLVAGVRARLAWLEEPPAPDARTVPAGLSPEKAEKFMADLKDENNWRSRWVGEGCQDALVRLARRWSPVREVAQARILTLRERLLSSGQSSLVNPIGVTAQFAWERGKMRGLDNAEAFAVASAGLSGEQLRALGNPSAVEFWFFDEEFFGAASAAAAAVAAR